MRQTEGVAEKRIFLSYSHKDRPVADRLARALHHAGESVWWDEWEILAGDSLIEKVFREGLSNASAFLILLSKSSVKSRWVLEELDVATIRKIEGLTRVIPVIVDEVEIPVSLRALRRIDLTTNFDKGVNEIVKAVHGISDKPRIAAQKSISARVTESLAGLSRAASTVALSILQAGDADSGQEIAVTGVALSEMTGLDSDAINDAVDELEESGFIRVLRFLGTAPYHFGQVQPTYVLYKELAPALEYDPEDDVLIVAAALASAGRLRAQGIEEATQLTPGRINRAIEYLEDYGLADVHKTLGTFPYRFSSVSANRRTRQLVGSN